MEQGGQHEIDPQTLESARTVIEAFGFGEFADSIVSYGDQQLTITEGLARHWDTSSQLDGGELYSRVAMYVELAKQQS